MKLAGSALARRSMPLASKCGGLNVVREHYSLSTGATSTVRVAEVAASQRSDGRCAQGHRPRPRLLAVISGCKHYASMPHVLVRDVPEDVHAALQRKAERRRQSLQQYLAVELRHLAERRSISEVLDEVEVQQGGRVGLQAAVVDLDEERSRR
jgi:hypothetical protein